MRKTYQKPAVKIIKFIVEEKLSFEEDENFDFSYDLDEELALYGAGINPSVTIRPGRPQKKD